MSEQPALWKPVVPKVAKGKVRIRRHTVAQLERPDGSVEEVERDESHEFDTETDFFSTSSSRTVHRSKDRA